VGALGAISIGFLDRLLAWTAIHDTESVKAVHGIVWAALGIYLVGRRPRTDRPGNQVHRLSLCVDDRGAEDAPLIVDLPPVDVIRTPDGTAEWLGSLPEQIAVVGIESPHVVSHCANVGNIVGLIILQLDAWDKKRLRLQPRVITLNLQTE
jgi:hypothetical protein